MSSIIDGKLYNSIRSRLSNKSKLINNSFVVNNIAYFYKFLKYFMYFYHTFFSRNNVDLNPINKKIIDFEEYSKNYNFEESIFLSIIIPAYNVEDYIEKCVDSIFFQNIPCEYEVIIVEDCSTDNTKNILKKIENKYNFVKVVYQNKNGGVSKSRNVALNNIKGKYITFIDSDDIICNNSLEKSIKYLLDNNDVDVVGFNFISFQNESIIPNYLKEDISLEPKIYNNIENARVNGFPWGKIYHRNMFEDVRFPQGLYWEDGIILKVVMQRCKKYVDLSFVGYLYRINPNSISNSIEKRNLGYDQFYMLQYCLDEIKRLNIIITPYVYIMFFLDCSIYLNNRTKYLPESDIRYMLSHVIKILDEIDCGFNMTYRQHCIINAIKNGNVKAWRAISF